MPSHLRASRRPIRLSRRALLVGGAAAMAPLATPTILRAAESGRRSFTIIREGDDIGSHVVDIRRSGDEISAAIDIEIQVKLLGITAYRYEMTARETWKAGMLVSLESEVNDDGDPDHARAKAVGGVIEIDGSDHQGTVPGDSVPTSYWSHEFLNRGIWINSQTGVPIAVTAAEAGPGDAPGPNGRIETRTWTVKGDNLDIVLHFIDRDWVSIEFDANDEPATYRPTSTAPVFMPVWNATVS